MLIGHQKIFERLKGQAEATAKAGPEAGEMSHAQLFLGPKHVGKTKVALLLAAILQGAEEDMVLKKHIFEGKDSDTVLLLDDGESLPIERIRGVLERASQSHVRPFLIFVIEELGRMKPEAVNALLKTLEEPHPGTIFFLTASSEEDVLPTLRSRSRVTLFQTVSDEEIREACKEHVYANELVLFAMGRPGKLMSLISDAELLKAHQEMMQDVLHFLDDPTVHAAFKLTRKYEGHEFLGEMLDILLSRARTFLLVRPPVLAHLDFTEVCESIEQAKQDLKQNVNAKLTLENLLLPFVP